MKKPVSILYSQAFSVIYASYCFIVTNLITLCLLLSLHHRKIPANNFCLTIGIFRFDEIDEYVNINGFTVHQSVPYLDVLIGIDGNIPFPQVPDKGISY